MHVKANRPSVGADFIKFRSGDEFLDRISAPWLTSPAEVYLLIDKTQYSLLLSDPLGSNSVLIMMLGAQLWVEGFIAGLRNLRDNWSKSTDASATALRANLCSPVRYRPDMHQDSRFRQRADLHSCIK